MESAVAMIVIPGIGGSEMSEELNGLSRELFSIFDVSCFPFRIGFIFCAVLFWMEYLGIFIIHFIKMEIFWNFLEDFFKIVQDPSCFS